MSFTYGAYTACLQDRSLGEALDVLKRIGLSGAEVNAGGFIPSPHIPVDAVIGSKAAREEYLGVFDEHGIKLTGLNTSGNPVSPLPNESILHAQDLRKAIKAAGALGVRDVVAMSGTPGTDPSAKYPTWIVNPWNGIDQEILDYQWTVVVPFFKEIDALARDNDVNVNLELHPRNLVFNVPSFERLIEETGATNIKVNLDPSHLFWQQAEPIEAAKRLGAYVGHVHAKDTRLFPGVAYRGVLDTDFGHVPADVPGQTPVAAGYYVTAWPQDPAWRFVAFGLGHDTDYWAEFLRTLQAINPDLIVNIEHEDAEYGNVEGLELSAGNLLAAAAKVG
ncbi:MAG: sugar phosphate isomerase/epimerase [Actinomyces sp.]|jgi:sugar phosphate isomerase/epimerase|uniref:Sugar phosphate isomerase/epimerase family protein n=1 Tax=Schaalia naturae TaxID=635203 RepID=A0ABW2SMW6_9ACTO|nr:sugar phosphate isomerase/epimerase [Actinomyces sp.]MCI1642218.1 sugar phosphate isomerase/epimerase [Actinomyces sp.]MCI1662597.1 sugar phosphate isomerase/epimerase [Actinomyces sp.]MCI1690974.1 sugar phosphate isomerase/epimerase [Actinomyces sp.]MCI1788317.1 sugar phosphate isomerase/epimerase [Actinomyces sp.]